MPRTGRPVTFPNKTYIRLLVPEELRKVLKDYSHDSGVPESEVIRKAIEQYLETH